MDEVSFSFIGVGVVIYLLQKEHADWTADPKREPSLGQITSESALILFCLIQQVDQVLCLYAIMLRIKQQQFLPSSA